MRYLLPVLVDHKVGMFCGCGEARGSSCAKYRLKASGKANLQFMVIQGGRWTGGWYYGAECKKRMSYTLIPKVLIYDHGGKIWAQVRDLLGDSV